MAAVRAAVVLAAAVSAVADDCGRSQLSQAYGTLPAVEYVAPVVLPDAVSRRWLAPVADRRARRRCQIPVRCC